MKDAVLTSLPPPPLSLIRLARARRATPWVFFFLFFPFRKTRPRRHVADRASPGRSVVDEINGRRAMCCATCQPATFSGPRRNVDRLRRLSVPTPPPFSPSAATLPRTLGNHPHPPASWPLCSNLVSPLCLSPRRGGWQVHSRPPCGPPPLPSPPWQGTMTPSPVLTAVGLKGPADAGEPPGRQGSCGPSRRCEIHRPSMDGYLPCSFFF